MKRNWKFERCLALAIALLSVGLLAGCTGWKPGEEGSKSGSSYSQTPDGYYRVKRGDTLHAIAFKFGMDWRNIALWNNIRAPYTIYPDQDLRLSAPGAVTNPNHSSSDSGSGAVVTAAAPARSSSTTTYDVPSQPRPAVTKAETGSSPAGTAPVTPAENPPRATTPAPSKAGDPAQWLWPADGKIISNFAPNDPARKGIDIGGKEGEAVVASAAGEVVYSGSGLIGYGELVIIKHNEQLLSAYAHNHKRLVTEGQTVAAGERIADMGKNDRNQPMLHFEIRLNGNPQDPLKYLPSR